MYGKSFVLVKPDGMNKEIKDEIIQTIQNRSISVVKQQKICLTVSDIENIWPYTQSDIVSRQLFMNYLLDKVCLLLYLESSKESLYKDIAAIVYVKIIWDRLSADERVFGQVFFHRLTNIRLKTE